MPAGYKIRGIAPYELRNYPDGVKLMFWSWVVDLGLKAKDRDLAQGLDARGEALRPISAKTRKYRKSAMTPDGKGDPSAPPLMPGRALSRTRSLLAGRAFKTHAEFYWRFDPWTHDTWGRILTYQKEKGRDVFGLSEESTDLVRRQALKLWMEWKRAGQPVLTELEGKRFVGAKVHRADETLRVIGKTNTEYATTGINNPLTLKPGKWSGGTTESELKAAMRQTAPANVQSRPADSYNRLLSHIWGHPGQATSAGGAVQPLTPKPPKPAAPAAPGIKARLDAWKEGDALVKAIQDIAEKSDREKRRARYDRAREELQGYLESLKPGDRRRKAVRERIAELTAEHDDAKTWVMDVFERSRQEIHRVLKADKPAKYVMDDMVPANADRLKREIKAGADWLFPLINDPKGVNQVPAILVIADSPDGERRGHGGGTGIHLPLTAEGRLVVHEIGHCLEDQLKGTIEIERKFLEYRAKGQARRKFQDLFPEHKYDASEEGIDDHFGRYFSPENSGGRQGKTTAWYVGKYYPNRSELLSMGLEALYDDGVNFATKDPEYCKFILGILTGALR